MAPMAVSVTGIHSVDDPIAAIESTEMVIVGGGNTFQLLKECRSRGLLAPIVDVVKRGALYIGWSAGSNLACPTIRTTNDMPIVDPQGFDALGLFPLQINPHFTNALPTGHQGETREQRIRELLVVAPELTVIGLPEGNWIGSPMVTRRSVARTRRCCSNRGRSDNPACGPPLLSWVANVSRIAAHCALSGLPQRNVQTQNPG